MANIQMIHGQHRHKWTGLSSETKPTNLAQDSEAFETDTGRYQKLRGTTWVDVASAGAALTTAVSAAGVAQGFVGDAALVSTAGSAGAVALHRLLFDDPADLNDAATDQILLDTIPATATKAVIKWHTSGLTGGDTQATQAFFADAARGAMISFNADAPTATARFNTAQTNPGGTSSAGVADMITVSRSAPTIVVHFEAGSLANGIRVFGMANGLTATHIDTWLPCELTVEFYG